MNPLRRFVKNEEGNVAVFAAITLGVILTMGAFAVDYGHIQDTIAKMQTAADAGATAGVCRLLNVASAQQGYQVEITPNIRDVVRDIVTRNPVPLDEQKTQVEVPDVDIVFGKWDSDNNCFASTVEPVPGTDPASIDTCEVTIRKNEDINGRLVNFFWAQPTPLEVVSRARLGFAGKFW